MRCRDYEQTTVGTYEAACEVDANGAPVLPEGDMREGVDAHPARVVVVARNGHILASSWDDVSANCRGRREG